MKHLERLSWLIGEDKVNVLKHSKVLVLGLGGVGGMVAEALARSGIGTLIIVDYDTVDETNLNRQVIATTKTIGKKKVEAMKERIQEIAPGCTVIPLDLKYCEETKEDLFKEPLDYAVDAIDDIAAKKRFIKECLSRHVPFISSMGTGNRMDPSQLMITELEKTSYDPIARILRRFKKDEKIKDNILVLVSMEAPASCTPGKVGSNSFVPPSAGLLIASRVVQDLIGQNMPECLF